MLFSELYEIMVKKVTFVDFRGGDRAKATDVRYETMCRYLAKMH